VKVSKETVVLRRWGNKVICFLTRYGGQFTFSTYVVDITKLPHFIWLTAVCTFYDFSMFWLRF